MEAGISLVAFVAMNFITALSGAFFRPGAWYRALAKPPWQPPDWLFAPVWTLLYICIAVSGWLVWRAGDPLTVVALGAYGLNLLLNAGWSAIFFGMRRIDLALGEIGALWLCTLALVILFARIDGLAGALVAPYLAWVSFAAVLNLAIWRRNRAAQISV